MFVKQVSYTPNIARSENSNIQVEIGTSSNIDPLLIPISFEAKTASFSVDPVQIKVRFCYINFPYFRCLTVTNNSDVDGYFCIIPQEVSTKIP